MKDNLSKIDGLISSQNTLNRVLVYGILYVIKSARWKSAVLMVQKAISKVQQIGKVLLNCITILFIIFCIPKPHKGLPLKKLTRGLTLVKFQITG